MILLRTLIKPFASPIRKILYREFDKRVRILNPHWTPITEFWDDDIFIVGYPRSGNTWFQNLVAGVVYGVDPEYAPDTLIQELVPDVHYKRYYKRFRSPMFFKSHHLPRPDYRRVVYLLRDGRDVMVSYWHYLSALEGREIDFLKMVRDGESLPRCKWHEHVESWLANPYKADMLVIRYEDLKSDCVKELMKFCDFIGIQRPEAHLQYVAEKASFVSLQGKIKKGDYFQENWKWPKDKPFFRRGIVGSYRDEMPKDVLEAFLAESEETLRRCHYL